MRPGQPLEEKTMRKLVFATVVAFSFLLVVVAARRPAAAAETKALDKVSVFYVGN